MKKFTVIFTIFNNINKIYLLTVCFFLIIGGIQKIYCQEYAPVVDSSYTSTWKVPVIGLEFIDIDSIYSIKTEDGYFELWLKGSMAAGHQKVYHGKIRHAEGNALLYWVSPDDEEEKLIMNLNLEIGDEFELADHNGHPFVSKVTAVYEEHGLKHVQFEYPVGAMGSYTPNITFIEGVGPNYGFYRVMPYYFICKHNNQELFYALEYEYYKDCKSIFPYGISNYNAESIINIFPNPAINEITISSNPNYCITNLHIMNFLGEIVYECVLENNLINLDISNWNKGVYFIKCITNGKNINILKFIKL